MPKMDDHVLFSSLRDKLFTAVVGDVLDKLGYRRQFLPQAIGPLKPDMTVVGRAMPVLAQPEDGLVILYTSGTTGLPKGAVVSHRAMIMRALVFTSELGIAPADTFVASICTGAMILAAAGLLDVRLVVQADADHLGRGGHHRAQPGPVSWEGGHGQALRAR